MRAIFTNNPIREFYLKQTNIDTDKLYLIVDCNPELEVLHVPAWKLSMNTEIAFSKIAELTHLTYLNLQGYSKIVDAHMESITKSNPRISKLIIDECVELTAQTTKMLAKHCTNLRHLSMNKCYKMTDEIFPSLAQLPLNYLSMTLAKITDVGMLLYAERAVYTHALHNLCIRRTTISMPVIEVLFKTFRNLSNIARQIKKGEFIISRVFVV